MAAIHGRNHDGSNMKRKYFGTDGIRGKVGEAPIIYLNDGTGSFDRVDATVMPAAPSDARGISYVIADLDGDGIPELIYYPITGFAGKENRIFVHKGLRKFTPKDAMK